MAISLAHTGTNTFAAATAIVVTKPTGTFDGELMLVGLSWATGIAAVTAVPSGWTLLESKTNGSNKSKLAVYWKIASGEGASWTWTMGAVADVAAAFISYNGSNGIDTSVSQLGAANTTSIVAPAITLANANEMAVGFFANVAAVTYTPDAAMAEQIDVNTGAVTNPVSIEVADVQFATSGNKGPWTAIASATATNQCGAVVGITTSPFPTPLFSPASDQRNNTLLRM